MIGIVGLSSEVSESIIDELNNNVYNVLRKVYKKEFESGEVVLKLNIKLVSKEGDNEQYKSPVFDYKINRTLKQNESAGGSISEGLKFVIGDDGSYVLEKVLNSQIDLESYLSGI
jgi:hypothetical protein